MTTRERALFDGYSVRELDEPTFGPLFAALRPQVFGERFEADVRSLMDVDERRHTSQLAARMAQRYGLRLGVFKDGQCVGWTFGWQTNHETFQMVNTGFLPEHQGRGLYTALLPYVLGIVQAEGFQIVTGRHHATNNAVLVPKLKAGFVITQVEVSDTFGLLVHLSYFFNARRRHLLDVRVGFARPDDEMRTALKLEPGRSGDAPS